VVKRRGRRGRREKKSGREKRRKRDSSEEVEEVVPLDRDFFSLFLQIKQFRENPPFSTPLCVPFSFVSPGLLAPDTMSDPGAIAGEEKIAIEAAREAAEEAAFPSETHANDERAKPTGGEPPLKRLRTLAAAEEEEEEKDGMDRVLEVKEKRRAWREGKRRAWRNDSTSPPSSRLFADSDLSLHLDHPLLLQIK
jgi:hypothetical protein